MLVEVVESFMVRGETKAHSVWFYVPKRNMEPKCLDQKSLKIRFKSMPKLRCRPMLRYAATIEVVNRCSLAVRITCCPPSASNEPS